MQQGLEDGIPREEIPLIQAEWFTDNYWYYYYISPFGDILEEGETPYEHKSHPYVFMAYPFIDGEIHSFVADVIDQQRCEPPDYPLRLGDQSNRQGCASRFEGLFA